MASETEMPEPSFLERLINSRNRQLSLFLPIILGLTYSSNTVAPDEDSQETADPRDRIIIINPFTQGMGMMVIEGSSAGMDSLLRELLSKDGQPPASKASTEAMPSVETKVGEECVICLEEFGGVGELAKEMPCKHKFHGGCVERWLKIHGSCPVCRYTMPVDEDQDFHGKIFSGNEEGERRQIWVSFSINNSSDRTNGDTDQTDSSSASPGPDQSMLE